MLKNKLIILIYRVLSFALLVTLSFSILIFTLQIVYFKFSNNWCAPFNFGPTQKDVVGYQSMQNSFQRNVIDLSDKKQEAIKLVDLYSAELKNSKNLYDSITRQSQNARLDPKIDYFDELALDLKSRLITFDQYFNILHQKIDLENSIKQYSTNLKINVERLASIEKEIQLSELFLNVSNASYLNDAFYKLNTIAFVPYSNLSDTKIGNPVFKCYFDLIFCRKVGTITAIYDSEEIFQHPIFRNNIRGKFIAINFEELDASQKDVLLLNYKPLFF